MAPGKSLDEILVLDEHKQKRSLIKELQAAQGEENFMAGDHCELTKARLDRQIEVLKEEFIAQLRRDVTSAARSAERAALATLRKGFNLDGIDGRVTVKSGD